MDSCPVCKATLSCGDVYATLRSDPENNQRSDDEILEWASHYGWTRENKVQFSRAKIIQPDRGRQYTICPDCLSIIGQ